MTPNLRLKSPRRLLRCTLVLGAAEPQSGGVASELQTARRLMFSWRTELSQRSNFFVSGLSRFNLRPMDRSRANHHDTGQLSPNLNRVCATDERRACRQRLRSGARVMT